MKFGGNVYSNFSNAIESKDFDYKRDVLLDEIARLIETDKSAVILILKDAGYKVDTKTSKKEVIKKVSHALHNNKQFQLDVAKEIVKENSHTDFSNAEGKFKEWFSNLGNKNNDGGGSAGGAGGGASKVGGDPISAIAGAIGAIFQFGASSKNKKSEEEKTKQELYNKLLGDNEKTNWLPIIIIGGVLVIGAIVTVIVLRNKR